MKLFVVGSLLAATGLAARMPVYLYTGEWDENDYPFATKIMAYAAAGASHLVLAFHVYTDDWAQFNYTSGSVKQLYEMPEADRKTLMDKLHAVGTQVIISTGGQTAGSTWADVSPAEYAKHLCGMAADLGVDGVDFDLEEVLPGFGPSMTEKIPKWNTDVIAECKKYFNGYITSAPQSPYVMPSWSGQYGFDKYGYEKLFIQYYNQGEWSGEDVKDGMFGNTSGSIPDLMKRNPDAPKDRFVVGKPLLKDDGTDNAKFTDEELKAWGCEAWKNLGWRGGFMFWQGHWNNPVAQMKVTMFSKPCPGEEDDDTTTSSSTPTPAPTAASTIPTPEPTAASTMPTPAPTSSSSTSTTPSGGQTGATDGIYDTICEGGDPSDPAIAGCIAQVKSEAWWIGACQANCLTLGPGGCLHESWCTGYDGSAESLLGCVRSQYPYCL
jgi:hypothetical protein